VRPDAAARLKLSWMVLRATPACAKSPGRSHCRGAAVASAAIAAWSDLSWPAFRPPRRPMETADALVADPLGIAVPCSSKMAGFKSECWPASFRYGGRFQIGMAAGFVSLPWPASRRNTRPD
jgi:hypothetical protein